jgi:uncharacterized protein YndB with AHSA1/START domain
VRSIILQSFLSAAIFLHEKSLTRRSDVGRTHELTRAYPAAAEEVWRLWTTAAGIERWWAPDGFRVSVEALELRPGGRLVYSMTATAPEQTAFLESVGLPLTTVSRKTFTEVEEPNRLAYSSLVDFVPDHEPYTFDTAVEIVPDDDGVLVRMTVEELHDATWTERLLAGRANELDNLGAVLAAGPA